MPTRRDFIKKSLMGAGLATLGTFPFESFAAGEEYEKLTILHTNDVHSHLEAFPDDGGRYAGQGGAAARATIIKRIRAEEKNVLLVDAGDIFQGTPYFNLYKGEPEIKAMNLMGYDVATMGNHDFDAGIDGFAKQLQVAQFPFVVANYDFSNTILKDKIAPYTIIRKGKLKIGVFGLGIQLWGLVPKELYGNTVYIHPTRIANNTARQLKHKEKCDLVLCLSHLGYAYSHNKISDTVLAKESENIDVIIGGHTHTFLDTPAFLTNKAGKQVIINQVGWAGLRLGRLDFYFSKKKGANLSESQTVIIQK